MADADVTRSRMAGLTRMGMGQVLGSQGEVVRRLKALGEGRMRHNKALLHALPHPGMQAGLPLGPLGQAAMHDGSGGPKSADFRVPQARVPVRPGREGRGEARAACGVRRAAQAFVLREARGRAGRGGRTGWRLGTLPGVCRGPCGGCRGPCVACAVVRGI
jgi:hypothetical protein